MTVTIQEALGQFLRTECLLVQEIVGTRVFWGDPGSNPAFPCVVFSGASERDIAEAIDQGSDLIEAQIEMVSLSIVSRAAAHVLARAVRQSLDRWTGRTPSTSGEWDIQYMRRTSQEDLVGAAYIEQGLYAVGQSYTVRARPFTA